MGQATMDFCYQVSVWPISCTGIWKAAPSSQLGLSITSLGPLPAGASSHLNPSFQIPCRGPEQEA
jgi:hypothetical protein